MFCPSRRFVPTEFWSSGCFVPLDVLSFRMFCSYRRFGPQMLCLQAFFLRTFCPSKCFVSGRFVWPPRIRLLDGSTCSWHPVNCVDNSNANTAGIPSPVWTIVIQMLLLYLRYVASYQLCGDSSVILLATCQLCRR
jgi:hypothetical protein